MFSSITNNLVGCDPEFVDAATTLLAYMPGKTVCQRIVRILWHQNNVNQW